MWNHVVLELNWFQTTSFNIVESIVQIPIVDTKIRQIDLLE